MTNLGFQLGEALGGDFGISTAETTQHVVTALVGACAVGEFSVGGESAIFYPYTIESSDSINLLQDEVSFPPVVLRTLTPSDSLNNLRENGFFIQYQGIFPRVAILLANISQRNLTAADSINNLVDSVRLDFKEKYLTFSDSIFNLSDSMHFALSRGLTASDQLQQLSDSFSWEYAEKYLSFSDYLTFYDSLILQGGEPDFTLGLTDTISIFFLSDSVKLQMDYLKSLSEDINNFADQFGIADPIAIQAYDTLQYNWADSVSMSFIMVLQVADVLDTIADSVNIVIATTVLPVAVADDLNNLLEAVTNLQVGIRLYLEALNNNDIIVVTDSIQIQMDHFLSKSEQLQQFLETLVMFAGDTNFADSINEYADSSVFTLGGEVSFSDSINNFSDSVSLSLGPQALNLTFSDSLNNLSDSAAVSLKNPLLTIVASDSVNFLVDGFSQTEGIIPGTIDVSRIRRYLGDLIN